MGLALQNDDINATSVFRVLRLMRVFRAFKLTGRCVAHTHIRHLHRFKTCTHAQQRAQAL